MIFSKKELALLDEMVELENQMNIHHPHSNEWMDAFRKWHFDYPQKLKNWRREKLGIE
jgi:hypothetical protein